jgi:hypothetical protein
VQKFPDSQKVAQRTIELLGGSDNFRDVIDAEFGEMQQRWNQDIVAIGRILRSHLYVEHYLGEYLTKANLRLGPVAQGRLTFAQKLALLDPKDTRLSDVLPGIKHLNKIRNRLAHNLSAVVTTHDASIFLSAKYFKAMRDEGAKPGVPSQDPLDVLEQFAQHASHSLGGEFSPFGIAFAKALSDCSLPAT